ncbi:MAG: hypothetical protein ACE5JU_20035 [Candidatus Binatia bacterium]
MKPLLDGRRNWLAKGRGRLICIWFFLVLFLTPPIFAGGVSQVFANEGDSGGYQQGIQETFNPVAFAIVSAGLVVVGYFMYRIFSGSGKKEGDGEKEG